MKIDETNLSIIKHLKDGRKSFKEIADDLSITENTVRARVNKMTEEGLLEITGLIDPHEISGHQLIIVGGYKLKKKILSLFFGIFSNFYIVYPFCYFYVAANAQVQVCCPSGCCMSLES